MKLLIDVGNSRLKWALTDGADWEWGVTDYGDGPGGWRYQWTALPTPLAIHGLSVAPDRVPPLEAFCLEAWGLRPRWYGAQPEAFGVRNLYEPPEALGADRYAALVAVRHRTQGPACVVTCGTAITIDALGPDGDFCGGVIMPGLRTAMAGLNVRIPHLPVPRFDRNLVGMERNTARALGAGLILGAAGAIDRILGLQVAALGVSQVFLGGGDSDLLRGHLRTPVHVERNLPLQGLALMIQ